MSKTLTRISIVVIILLVLCYIFCRPEKIDEELLKEHIITVEEALQKIDRYRHFDISDGATPPDSVPLPMINGALAGTYDLASLEMYIKKTKQVICEYNKTAEVDLVYSGVRFYYGTDEGTDTDDVEKLTTILFPAVHDADSDGESTRSLLMGLLDEETAPVYLEDVIELVRQENVNVFNPDTTNLNNSILERIFSRDRVKCAYNRSQMCPPKCCCQ